MALAGFIGLCLLVGVSGAGFTATAVAGWYRTLTHPPGTPPDWLFGPVWTALYIVMGVSAWLVWRRRGDWPKRAYAALRLWGWQLLLNALWTPVFFGLHSFWAGVAVILALLALIVATIAMFRRVSAVAAGLLLPYAVWVAYASYLTIGLAVLN